MFFQNLIGQKYGNLTVVDYAPPHIQPNGLKRTMWLCCCDCGNQHIAYAANLRNGHTLSCGCVQKERAKESATTHRGTGTRLHRTWAHMLERCRNPNARNYKDYGGRGITVCKEWLDFKNFYQWSMENGYKEDLTIDRINNDGNYCPENCRFADIFTQANNKRSNHKITINGETKNVTQWAKEKNMNLFTILSRIEDGWSEEAAVCMPSRKAVAQI